SGSIRTNPRSHPNQRALSFPVATTFNCACDPCRPKVDESSDQALETGSNETVPVLPKTITLPRTTPKANRSPSNGERPSPKQDVGPTTRHKPVPGPAAHTSFPFLANEYNVCGP